MVSDQIREVIKDCVANKSAHVIDLVVRGEKGAQVVEVFIDAEEGITTDRCSEISRELSNAIDAGRLIEGSYRLEISSPGIERPLKFPWQYRKHIGRQMEVKVRSGQGTEKRVGRFLSMDDTGVVLQVGKKNENVQIPFDALVEARVKAPW